MLITVGGREVSVESLFVGSVGAARPVLVFLHEGLGSAAMWRDFPHRLCEAGGYRGLVFSRPGYGRSTPRSALERWGVDYLHVQARVVLPAVLKTAGVEHAPWLVGHSDGASIALIHAATFPDQTAGVVALAPHIFVEDRTVARVARARQAYLTTALRERLTRYHDDVDSAFWGWNDAWLDPAFRDWSIETLLGSITCPVLAVQGNGDEYGTMAQLDGIAAAVPRAQLLKLAHCGHHPHRDRAETVIAAITAFIIKSRH
jgi:pimeloyl-ACP methyl ester carboxylesterase